jgi:hypothetical protein
MLQLGFGVLHVLCCALSLRSGFGCLLLGALHFGGSGFLDVLILVLYLRVLGLQLADLPVGSHHHIAVLGFRAMQQTRTGLCHLFLFHCQLYDFCPRSEFGSL